MGSAQSSGSTAPQAQAMVSTRRSSRLQARSGTESSPTSSGAEAEAARASPARVSRRSPRKKQREEEEEEKVAEESAEDIPVDDESAEEANGADTTDSDAVGHVEERTEPSTEQEEEEEILLLDEEEEEEEDVVELPADDDAETETDEDTAARGEEDVAGYALLAATGLDLFGTGSGSASAEPAASAASVRKRTAAAVKRSLVPDQLDSGAAQHAAFLEFKGRRHAEGAALLQDARTKEEQSVVSTGLDVVARSHAQREETRQKTAGRKWFDMASEELSADARRDFALLRMRNYLDPKKFYKSSDHHKKLPKHFQMGVVVEGAHEFKSARMTKKERRQTFTDEIMADDSVRQYTKRVFSQVQAARSGRGKKKAKKTHRAF